MTLLFDQREALRGKPGLHALIVGISEYPHLTQANAHWLGLSSNSSGAITGYRIYQWLIQHQQHLVAPLATCRLMISPSAEETKMEPRLQELAVSCNVDDFLRSVNEWRRDAQERKENITLLYFVGNGFELSKSNPIIMLQNFGDGIGPALRGGVTATNLFYGMGPTSEQPDIARTQLYFIDTDRVYPSRVFQSYEEINTTAAFDALPLGIDDRDAAIFYSTSSGKAAYAYNGEATFFSLALLKCLEGAAAVPGETDQEGTLRWQVSITSLMNGLNQVLPALIQDSGVDQLFEVGGQVRDSIICYLDAPPVVDLAIEVDPIEALAVSHVEMCNEASAVVFKHDAPLQPHPYWIQLPAGYYTLRIRIAPPDLRFKDLVARTRLLTPPRAVWKVKVAS